MEYTEIGVPDMNDSFSRVVLEGVEYQIRFTWNMLSQRWSFGLYTSQRVPLAVGIRIVPSFPLNMQIVDENFPFGVFGVITQLDEVTRNDFANGKAKFVYLSASQVV